MTFWPDLHTHGERGPGKVTSIVPEESVDYLDQYSVDGSDGWVSVGLHPWRLGESAELREKRWCELESLARRPSVVAIGETGIDRLRSDLTIGGQQELFIRHIELAESLGLPLVIHAVRSLSEIFSLRKSYRKVPWLLHGFTGNSQQIAQAHHHGVGISPGVALLFYKGIFEHPLFERLALIEAESLFIESDGTEIALEQLYRFVAERRGSRAEELRDQVWRNLKRDFPLAAADVSFSVPST